ncbi:WD40 repeat-like protein, partial [Gyrodon lividus]
MQFFPDGRRVVRISEHMRATRLHAPDFHRIGSPLPATIRAVSVSRDGRWIVTGGDDGRLTIWDAQSEQISKTTVERHNQGVLTVDVTPDSSVIASAAEDSSVILWSLATGEVLAGPLDLGGDSRIWYLQISPAGDRLAAVFHAQSQAQQSAVYIWDITGGEQLTQLIKVPYNAPGWLDRVKWLDDRGERVIAGSHESLVVIDTTTGSTSWQSFGFIDVSSNGKFILTFKWHDGIEFLDATTYAKIGPNRILCHPFSISPDDRLLVGGGLNYLHGPSHPSTISLWCLRDLLPIFYTIASPLIKISNAALVAWYEGNLTDAEAILTEEIKLNPETSYHALANRAVIRVRLGRLDTSLDDSEKSVAMQPTAIAHVAGSIALNKQGKYELAMQAIHVALGDYPTYEKEIVLLVKTILMFKAGFCDEAIDHITTQMELAVDKRMYRFVQAYMCTLLAKAAMAIKRYDEAVRLLKGAQVLGPFGKVPKLDTIFLLFGWRYETLWFEIHQKTCEALLAARRMKEIVDFLKTLVNEFEYETKAEKEKADWLSTVKQQCVEILENLGDRAMQSQEFGEAIIQYSIALAVGLGEGIFIKRSEAQAALQSWDESLNDAEEAIKLNPSSPRGFERKYATLRAARRYDEATQAFYMMISKLQLSTDPMSHRQRRRYTSLSERTAAETIDAMIQETLKRCPPVLIDIKTGHLCQASARIVTFETEPVFQDLLSSMTSQLDEEHIRRAVEEYFQYVTLSHKWDEHSNEPKYHDVLGKSVYGLVPSSTNDKLRKFCETVRKAGYRWAWSDTCCIDKSTSSVLNQSITSMYKWYEEAALTLAVLTVGSPSKPGDLRYSVWMTRGWTLQELLASKVIRFYDSEWNLYLNDTHTNHKESPAIMKELVEVISVAPSTVATFRPSDLGVREKLRLASTRRTTLEEDIAYCLIGIFDSDLMPKYGEGEAALGRLLQEIVARSGDVTILAWTGKPSSFNTSLPADIVVYKQSPYTHPTIAEGEMESRVAPFRGAFPPPEAVKIYDKVTGLRPPRFSDRRLYLPCIIFPVKRLVQVLSSAHGNAYSVRTSALGDVEIKTTDSLSLKQRGELLLVHPWIRDLVGQAYPQGWFTWGDSSDSDSDDPTGPSSLPKAAHAQTDDYTQALNLIVRLGQPFSALLLKRKTLQEYVRVAADQEIIVQIRKLASLKDVRTDVLEIL